MDLRRKSFTALVIGGIVLAAAAMMTATGRGEKPAVPAVQLVGHESKITTERFVLIKDEAAWAKLWAEHSGVDGPDSPMTRHAAPKVDFSRFMVVGVFAGAQVNCDGEVAQSVELVGESLRVRYEASMFQTMSLDGEDHGDKTRPYGLWVVDRTEKTVVIERGKRSLKNEPVRWVEAARFGGK